MPSAASTAHTYTTWDMLRDLRPFLSPYKVRFVIATLVRLAADIAWLYPAYALASLVTYFSAYAPGMSLTPVWNIFLVWGVATIVRQCGMYISKRIMYGVAEKMSLNAQLQTIEHLFLLDLSWHEHENSGNKLKRLQRGGDNINRLMRMWVNNFIEIGVNFVGMLFILAQFDGVIAMITLVFIVTYYLLASIFRKRAAAASHVVNIQDEEINGLFFESLNSIRTVKVLSMRKPLIDLLRRGTVELYRNILKRIFWFQTGNNVRAFYAHAFRIGVSIFIVYGIIEEWYVVGFLVLFNNYFGQITASITELAEVAQEYVVAKLSVERMTDILRVPVGIDQDEGKVLFPKDWQTISLRNVSFAYGDNEVLRDVSFDVHRGERVGIVGLSGAGKSTLFKLLLKEQEATSGEISIDTVPLHDIRKDDYYRHAAAVLQDTEVLNFSLRQNITLANYPEKDNEELLTRSLSIAHVSDFLGKLPDGVDTLIGEKGVKLSGGERQRLGIARAVFKQPQFLLLDEATSHLDVESEEKIRTSLHEFFQQVTALVIAHRLSTVREMDRIIVLEDGGVVEQGSFDELYARGGRFYELWEKQKL